MRRIPFRASSRIASTRARAARERYPLPVIERIASEPVPHAWQAVHLGERFAARDGAAGDRRTHPRGPRQGQRLRLLLSPERDQACIGWACGAMDFGRRGVFNWPQHHRPRDVHAVRGGDRARRRRLGDGVVFADRSALAHEGHARRLPASGQGGDRAEGAWPLQPSARRGATFLWWANVATRVHEKYQSFFPPDVRFVADHAKRAITSFPRSDRPELRQSDFIPPAATHGVAAEEQPARAVPPRRQLSGRRPELRMPTSPSRRAT